MFWAYPGQWGGPEQQGRGPSIVALWRTLYVVDTGVNLRTYLLLGTAETPCFSWPRHSMHLLVNLLACSTVPKSLLPEQARANI